jgi:hypothetical protein
MTAEIFTFDRSAKRRGAAIPANGKAARPRTPKALHNRLLFRSRDLILQAGEADLIRDVRFDIG